MNCNSRNENKSFKYKNTSNSINNRKTSKVKTEITKFPLSKQTFLKQNKSIVKYLSKKLSDMDAFDNDNTNLYLSTNNISSCAHVNSSITSSTYNYKNKNVNISIDSNSNNLKSIFNSYFSGDKINKINRTEKSQKEEDTNFNLNIEDDFKTENEHLKMDLNKHSSVSYSISKEQTEPKSFENNNIKTFQIDNTPRQNQFVDGSDTDKRLQELKTDLIELINQTKDKSRIIKELDSLYINVLKLQIPSKRNISNIIPIIKDSSEEDKNNSIALFYSSSVNNFNSSLKSKRSNSNNPREFQISEDDKVNNYLKQENKLLKSKIEELDKKISLIHNENKELQSYIQKKSENFDYMENIIKKFQIEINKMKTNQLQQTYNNFLTSNEINKNYNNLQPLKITSNSNLIENPYTYNINKDNQMNNELIYSSNHRRSQINHSLKQSIGSYKKNNNFLISNNNKLIKNKTNSKTFDLKNKSEKEFLKNNDSLNEEESPSIFNSSLSITQLDNPEIHYLPPRVIYNNIKNKAINLPESNMGKSGDQMLDTDSDCSSEEKKNPEGNDYDIKLDEYIRNINDSQLNNINNLNRFNHSSAMDDPNVSNNNKNNKNPIISKDLIITNKSAKNNK